MTPGVYRCDACEHCFQPAVEAAERQLAYSETDKIRSLAVWFTVAAVLLAIVGALILIFSVLSGIAAIEWNVGGFILAGSLMAAAFWLFLLAQVIHIRANTAK